MTHLCHRAGCDNAVSVESGLLHCSLACEEADPLPEGEQPGGEDSSDKMVEVQLHGVTLWCYPEVLKDGVDGALAPPEHVRDGALNWATCFTGDSYAHVYATGEIKRYRQVIGRRCDLLPACPSCHGHHVPGDGLTCAMLANREANDGRD